MATGASPEVLEALLRVQAHDTALDQLRRRRSTLPERAELTAATARRAELEAVRAERSTRRAEVGADEGRLAAEAAAVSARMAEVDATLYSGTVTSPRELQALQQEIEQLRRHRDGIEDRELTVMEEGEGLDGEVAAVDAQLAEVDARIAELEAALGAAEAELDAVIATETEDRTSAAAPVGGDLLADYERRRGRNRRRPGVGIARLVGTTCQGCGLAIPAVEADTFRRAPSGTLCEPEDCDCVLVP